MNNYRKELKLIFIALSLLVFITFVPNALLRNWIFISFIFVDFYFVANFLNKRSDHHVVLNSALIGMFILMVVSIILNRVGF